MNYPPTVFTRYLRTVAVVLATHPEYRPGQVYYNVLSDPALEFHALRPAWFDATLGNDPFHHDDRVPEFIQQLRDSWRELR